jgi:hypothetical protein
MTAQSRHAPRRVRMRLAINPGRAAVRTAGLNPSVIRDPQVSRGEDEEVWWVPLVLPQVYVDLQSRPDADLFRHPVRLGKGGRI